MRFSSILYAIKAIFGSRRALPFFFLLITYALVQLAGENPQITERVYTASLYPLLSAMLSAISALFPFSMWDSFWGVLVFLLLGSVGAVVTQKLSFRRWLLRLMQALALIYVAFYFLWGFNYFRPSIEERLNWPAPTTDTLHFRQTFDQLIVATNAAYIDSFQQSKRAINDAIENSYRENAPELLLPFPNGVRRPKTMIFSNFIAKTGIAGYFGPFFNEIHINGILLPTQYPFVLAHEKAHQFGITSEAEANFIAFVICSRSSNRDVRYSAYISLLQYYMREAYRRFPDYAAYRDKISAPVRADIRAEMELWRTVRNETLDKAQTAANNAYLKTNRIKDGVGDYNRVVALSLTWMANQQ